MEVSPVTSATTFSDEKEALAVVERAGLSITPVRIIHVPTTVSFERDEELESAINYLQNECYYFWVWEIV